MAKRHEAARKNSQLAKSKSKRTYTILSDGETDSGTGEQNSYSYESNEVVFLAKKGTGENRNVVNERERGTTEESQQTRVTAPTQVANIGAMVNPLLLAEGVKALKFPEIRKTLGNQVVKRKYGNLLFP